MLPELIPIGLATIMLGTIHEEDGVQEHQFWLRNDGAEEVVLQQGYASCHCTTIEFDQGATVAPGDSTCVTLRFNPQGKGGEFYETGTVKYGQVPPPAPHARLEETQGGGVVTLAFEGECITSEETLLRQYPVQLNAHLSLSRDRFDLGIMTHGSQRTLYVGVLHWDDDTRRESLSFTFTADRSMMDGQGVAHVPVTLTTQDGGEPYTFTVMIDVIVK